MRVRISAISVQASFPKIPYQTLYCLRPAITASRNGTSVLYTVANNNSLSPRSAQITVGDQIVTIGQAEATCAYFIVPSSVLAPVAGDVGYVSVTTTGSNCPAWTPTSSAAWLTLGAPIFDPWDSFIERVLVDRPAAYWGFHEQVGATTAYDYTGHGITGTSKKPHERKWLGQRVGSSGQRVGRAVIAAIANDHSSP